MTNVSSLQEHRVAEAFSRQSSSFDDEDNNNKILQYMRSAIRAHLTSVWKKGDYILELNSGTGLDAVFFAQQGFRVHATDNAEGMLLQLRNKVSGNHLEQAITVEKLSFNHLYEMEPHKFNHIFSNFGGLNCAENIAEVIAQFSALLTPDGTVTLMMMPPVCPWEIALALKGNFKTAFRRFNKKGADSHLEGVFFKTWYYSPQQIEKFFGDNYKRIFLRSLCLASPPPYLDKFPERFPGLFSTLVSLDKTIGGLPVLRSWGDHFIITLMKK